MDAIITGEGDGIIGLSVIDNNNVEHLIEIDNTNKITAHQSDGYHDEPAKRTNEESEYLNQARRLAKWTVYRERGYDTITPYENPDRIVAAIRALLDLTDVEIDYHFNDLKTKLRSHQNGSPQELPFDGIDSGDMIVYRKDIWVHPDPTDAEPPLLEQFCEYVGDPLDTLGEILGDGPDPRESMPSYEIEAVSDVHYLRSDGLTRDEHWADQPLEREPDARIELLPVDGDVFDSWQTFLVSHLGNQIRDCFLEMGCEPPEPFQTQGLGKHDSMVKQQLMGMYDQHFVVGQSVNNG